MKANLKNMFRGKDRRKLMRNRSAETGTDQPQKPQKSQQAQPSLAPPVLTPSASQQLQEHLNQQQQQQLQQQQQQHESQNAVPMPPLTRRSTLHRTQASLAQYRATPITKHYALNNQILQAFENHYENKLYTVAYAIGFQFVETALLEIPKHGYFYSNRHTQDRTTNSLNAIRVSNMLLQILELQREFPADDFAMDLGAEFLKVRKLHNLALQQAEEKSTDEYEANRAALEHELIQMRKHEYNHALLGDANLLDYSFSDTTLPPSALLIHDSSSKPAPDLAETKPGPRPEQAPPGAIPPPPLKERSVSSMMREMMGKPPGGGGDRHHTPQVPSAVPPPPPRPPNLLPNTNPVVVTAAVVAAPPRQPDPPSYRTDSIATTIVPPPPALHGQLSDSGWMGILSPEDLPRPEFGRQMSGRSYADHVALERALYLSGLEVQPNVIPHVPEEDDDNWMLEHALKESEREMEKLREQEELFFQQAVQQSEKQQVQEQHAELVAIQRPPQHPPPSTTTTTTTENVPSLMAPSLQRRVTKSRLEIETLHGLYHEDFVHLWNSGRVRVTHVHTYQGKNPGSTNGCTVIAPLLCIHHFINFVEEPGGGGGIHGGGPSDDPGLPDDTVKSVIDEEVPNILPKVREELGVSKDAFLIPSDSHDYLLKNQLLSQDQFVTCIGGNILDERHLQELVRCLADGRPPANPVTQAGDSNGNSDNKTEESKEGTAATSTGESKEKEEPPPKPRDLSNCKLACTLFFHEHVVSILKLRRAHGGTAWFDIIDSLPSKQMLSREVGAFVGHDDRNGAGPVDEFGFSLHDVEDPINCARIRCLDEEALSVALRWYACSRFNSENLNYIDTYPWDDHSTDFDPRVFQAFVWTEAS